MTYNFFATLSRMKYIERWALMRNAREETLSEHTLDVAMIAHALCVIGNKRFIAQRGPGGTDRALPRRVGDHHRRHAYAGQVLQR